MLIFKDCACPSNLKFVCTRSKKFFFFLCCDIQRLSQRGKLVSWHSLQKSTASLNPLRWPPFQVDIMSLWEMHSELQDDTLALEGRLWLQMHLSAATLLSSSSSSSTSLPGEGEQWGDRQNWKRGGERDGGEWGREANVMQRCAVQTEEAVWMPITIKFSSLYKHTHIHTHKLVT